MPGCFQSRTAKYAALDFTTPQNLWVLDAAAVGQSHNALNQIMLAIGCEQNHTLFLEPNAGVLRSIPS